VVLGVDGRRGGWAVAVVEGRPDRARVLTWLTLPGQDAGPVLDLAHRYGARVVGLDVPVGLPAHDWRPVDLLAKRTLGRAHPRVFLVPPREVLRAPDYAGARARCRDLLGGRGLSAQTWGLRGPVLAVDDALAERPPARGLVVETHPELSFAAMTGGVLPSKKTPEGRTARVRALAAWLDGPPAPPGDDHLDAAACAWSALRWSGQGRPAGPATVLGGDEDERGLPMRIVV
jgi:predicted RNase H-like nuclease